MQSAIEREKPSRKSERNFVTIVKAVLVAAIVLISCFLVYTTLFPLSTPDTSPKAAIVDQLSTKCPNNTFVQTSTSILVNAGFTVDYYESGQVTVEFYVNLPKRHYDLVVLRVHSITHEPEAANFSGLFTSELWDNRRYAYEKATDQILGAAFIPYHDGDPVYFAISSEFVRLSMIGNFNNTAIVMMGCSALTYTDMAEAFVNRGAKVCIGWNDLVSSTHTDHATAKLLKRLITEKEAIGQATTKINKEVGPDPEYNSTLTYFPREAESYVIPTTEQGSTSNALSCIFSEIMEPSFCVSHVPALEY